MIGIRRIIHIDGVIALSRLLPHNFFYDPLLLETMFLYLRFSVLWPIRYL